MYIYGGYVVDSKYTLRRRLEKRDSFQFYTAEGIMKEYTVLLIDKDVSCNDDGLLLNYGNFRECIKAVKPRYDYGITDELAYVVFEAERDKTPDDYVSLINKCLKTLPESALTSVSVKPSGKPSKKPVGYVIDRKYTVCQNIREAPGVEFCKVQGIMDYFHMLIVHKNGDNADSDLLLNYDNFRKCIRSIVPKYDFGINTDFAYVVFRYDASADLSYYVNRINSLIRKESGETETATRPVSPKEVSQDPRFTLPKGTGSKRGEAETAGESPVTASKPRNIPATPSKPVVSPEEKFSDHLFMIGKDMGVLREFRGNVAIICLAVSDVYNMWSKEALQSLNTAFDEAAALLHREAKRYGVDLQLSLAIKEIIFDGHFDVNNTYPIVKYIMNTSFKTDISAFQGKFASEGEFNDVPLVFAINRPLRSYAFSTTSLCPSEEYTVVGRHGRTNEFSGVVIAHEILHLFGARDYYVPAKFDINSRRLFPDSIMHSGKTVDDLTAYTIGWRKTLSRDAISFLEATASVTVEEYIREKQLDAQKYPLNVADDGGHNDEF